MSVLLQPFVEEQVIGKAVAITQHPYRAELNMLDAFFVNIQDPRGSVTDHRDKLPEQVVIFVNEGDYVVELLSKSGYMEGKTILTQEDCVQIHKILDLVRKSKTIEDDVDVEFLLIQKEDKSRHVVLLQARPYIPGAK